MKFRFTSDHQDPFDGLFDAADDEAFLNFLHPAENGAGNPPPSAHVKVPPTPALTSEAAQAQSAQSGATTAVAATSGGITINLLFDAAAMAAPASFRAGIQQAASILTSAISDKITVNIAIDYSGTGGGAAAGPDNGLYESYSSVRANLINNATPGDTVFNGLPSGASFQGQSNVAVWNAQLKLFGLLGANDTTTDDGSATFATDISGGLLVGVALHELTHAMGRVPYGPPYGPQPDIFDFFRFTGAGNHLIAGGNTAPAAYFSVDGGNTKLADYGQNSDPSDFLNSGVQGGNDPFNEYYTGSTSQTLTAADKAQLDALGFHTAVVHTPLVTTANLNLAQHIGVAASSLFSATDPDNHPITAYEFWDSTRDPNSGHFFVSGVMQQAGTVIDVTAAQLAQTSFVTGSVSNALQVRAFDGFSWSAADNAAWAPFNVNVPANHPPVVTTADLNLAQHVTVAASSLFSVTDPDNNPITAYEFWDSTRDPNSGHFVVNGVAEPAGTVIDVTAAQLAQTSFVTGAVSNALQVRAFDGFNWSATDNASWAPFNVNVPASHPPVVTTTDLNLAQHTTVAASSLFSVTDPDNNPITAYEFWDSTRDPNSGHFVINGAVQPAGTVIDVTAAQLAQTSFVTGSVSNALQVRAFDGINWSAGDSFAWAPFNVNVPANTNIPANHPPVVTTADLNLAQHVTVAASSLFSVTDPDNHPITAYEFWDSTRDPNSGHFVVNGVVEPAGTVIDVTAAQLAQTSFVTGSVSNALQVRAFDGIDWSAADNAAWAPFHILV
jgi:hypothetical protein